MRIFLTTFSLCILLTSCEVFNSSNCNKDSELPEAIKKWQSTNTQNYTFQTNRTCECMPPYKYTVEVVNGEVTDVHFEKEDHLNYESKAMIIQSSKTIDQLFDILGQYENTADYFEVTFHEIFGYPTKINIDPNPETADEEIILEISKFTSINN
ncbi:MAG: hypothetical protein JJ895_03815 [Balneolaceae bacterium]|nr:hypothetical protein [Balneolaceae bacterium]